MKANIPQAIVVLLIVATLVYSRKTETPAIRSASRDAGAEATANGLEPGGHWSPDGQEKDSIRFR